MQLRVTRHILLRIGIVIATALTVTPIWVAPVLVTQDGPSHVYNASLATRVHENRTPFVETFEVKQGVHPNVATHSVLGALAARLGPQRAERLVATLAVLGTFCAALVLVHPATTLVPLVALLSSSWFVWMGFYDFALSLPCFIALLVAVRGPADTRRNALMVIAFVLLYLTHIFTFAAGIALAAAALARDVRAERKSWRGGRTAVVLGATALLIIEMGSGSPAAGSMQWTRHAGLRLVDLVTSDFMVALHGPDTMAGLVCSIAVIAIVVTRFRDHRGGAGMPALSATGAFGLALIALSLVAPDTMGEGGYVPGRMRILGVLALLPDIALLAQRLPRAALVAANATLVAALVVRGGWIVRDAGVMEGHRQALDRLLTEAGVAEGDWVLSRLTVYRRRPFRVGAYGHLVEGVAASRAFTVLDNYEALNGVFSVSWRTRPDWITFRPYGDTLVARFIPGALHPPGPVYVVHERDRLVSSADARLAVGATRAEGRWAVTSLHRR